MPADAVNPGHDAGTVPHDATTSPLPDTDTDSDTEPDSETDSETDSDTEPDSETDADTDTEIDTDAAWSQPDAGSSGGPDAGFGFIPFAAEKQCKIPEPAPFVQVDHEKAFPIVWDTLSKTTGGELLVEFCSGNPGDCASTGRACTIPRTYKSIKIHYWINLSKDCKKSDKHTWYWNVDLVMLYGPPKDRHHAKDFKDQPFTGVKLDGKIHMFKLSDFDRTKMKTLFDGISLDADTAALRLKGLDQMVTQTTWHERQHEAFIHKFLVAREQIVNDPRYPTQVKGPAGTSTALMRQVVLNHIGSDRKARLAKAKAAEKKCHDDLHAWLKKLPSYDVSLKRCVCGVTHSDPLAAKTFNSWACGAVKNGIGGGPPTKPHPCTIPTE